MARARIEDLGTLTRAQVSILRQAGVRNLDEFRRAAYARCGRRQLAERIGVGEEAILEAVRRADLCRVSGVGPEMASLLHAAGVGSARELSQQRAPELVRNCLRHLEDSGRNRCRRPSVGSVGRFIAHATELPPGFEL